MAEERIVYLVTAGSYSDYKVIAVFLERHKAEAYLAQMMESRDCREDSDIEEWAVDETSPEELWQTTIWMTREGEVTRAHTSFDQGKWGFPHFQKGQRRDRFVAVVLVNSITTRDVERGTKRANEARLQMLALARWPDDSISVDDLVKFNGELKREHDAAVGSSSAKVEHPDV